MSRFLNESAWQALDGRLSNRVAAIVQRSNARTPADFIRERGVGQGAVREIAKALRAGGMPSLADDLEAELRRFAGPSAVRESATAARKARARLASAAPDMARALLAVEWGGWDFSAPGESDPCCPVCKEWATFEKHAPDCALDAALRKAGVPR